MDIPEAKRPRDKPEAAQNPESRSKDEPSPELKIDPTAGPIETLIELIQYCEKLHRKDFMR
jgi:hypothetical protein